jgi:hypothetical protein
MRRSSFVRSLSGIVTAVLACAWLAASARATTVERMNLAALSQRSDDVIEARVLDVRAGWSPSHTQIFTTVKLDVIRVLGGGGAIGPREIRLLGGAVNDTSMVVEGMPQFVPGEVVALFVDERPGVYVPIYGAWQGKLVRSLDPVTGAERFGNASVGYFERSRLATLVARARAVVGKN